MTGFTIPPLNTLQQIQRDAVLDTFEDFVESLTAATKSGVVIAIEFKKWDCARGDDGHEWSHLMLSAVNTQPQTPAGREGE